MANAGLGAFLTGFGNSVRTERDRKESAAASARAEELVRDQLAASERIANLNFQAAQAGAPGGFGLGAPPPGAGATGPTPGVNASTGGGDAPFNERELLARTIQAEAGGEGYGGMLAVGAVIGNRARSGKYGGNDLRGVIMAPGQFSAWNGVTGYAGGKGALNMGEMMPSGDAYRAADAIIAGGYDDPTGGATHYYNPAAASPAWGKAAGGNWQTIGNHIFGSAAGRKGAHPKQAGAAPPRSRQAASNAPGLVQPSAGGPPAAPAAAGGLSYGAPFALGAVPGRFIVARN